MWEPDLVQPPAAGPKPAQQLNSAPLANSYRAWRALRGERFAPSRKEIEPVQFKSMLGSMFIMDVVDGGTDFRFVLGGERVASFMGKRLRGTLLSEQPRTPIFEGMAQLYRQCVRSKEPLAVGPMRTVRDGVDCREMEVLVLPLSDDGKSVTSLLGAIHFSQLTDPKLVYPPG